MGSCNLLHMRPICKANVTTSVTNDHLNLVVSHNKWFSKLVSKYLGVPEKSYITLDSQGAYVWQHCIGEFTIAEIMESMHNQFGTEAEPVLERLIVFIQILARNRLIILQQ